MEVRGYRVFYIDQKENIDDIVNLLETTTARKLALVVHSRQPILSAPEKLNIIKENVCKNKKELVLINPDPRNIEPVRKSGFHLYPDLTALKGDVPFQVAATGEEDEKSLSKERGGGKKQLIFTIIGITVILFLAWIYFIYPIVTIDIKPVTKIVKQEITVKGSLTKKYIDQKLKVLPLHKFEVTLTDEEEVATTGKKVIGKSRATGVVKFINEREKEVIIPAGTKLENEAGIYFKTLKKVKVPKLTVDHLMGVKVGMKAGQAEVKIQALKKGSRGNVSTGRINKLSKNINGVHVINPEPTINGSDEKIAIVNKKDIKKLENNLREKIKTKLISKIYQKLSGNYRIIANEIKYSEIDFKYSHQPGDAIDMVKGTGTLVARGYLLRNNELDRLVNGIFKENLQKDYHLLSSGINVEKLTLAEKEDDLYNILLELQAPVIPKIKEAGLIQKLAGLKVKAAKELLSKQTNIETYSINCKSVFLPRFGFAIRLKVTQPDQSVYEGGAVRK